MRADVWALYRLMGFDVYFKRNERVVCTKIDYRRICFRWRRIVFLLLSSLRGEKRKNKRSLHFPVKLIRFFVRSISRVAEGYLLGTQPPFKPRGLPVINFTSVKSRDFQSTRSPAFFVSRAPSNKTNIIQTRGIKRFRRV